MAMTFEQQQQLLTHLLKENLILEARTIVLQKLFVVSQAEGNPQDLKSLNSLIQQEVQATVEHLIASHPIFDASWKELMKDLTKDIPGINLMPSDQEK